MVWLSRVWHTLKKRGRREPSNRLTPGFISSARYQLGAMQCNTAMKQQATCELPTQHRDLSTVSWLRGRLGADRYAPPDHPAYEEAVEAYFATLDSCAGIRVPRSFPKIGPIGCRSLQAIREGNGLLQHEHCAAQRRRNHAGAGRCIS